MTPSPGGPPVLRPTRAEIDLGALQRNADRLAARAGGAAVYGVIKADGYGHGAVEVAQALGPVVRGVAVSLVEEGIQLREAGVDAPILVMGSALGDRHDLVVEHGLTPLVFREQDIRAFDALGRARRAPVPVHLKIDTGMSRLGVRWTDVGALLDLVGDAPGIRWEGVCTHLANADLPDDSLTHVQLERFGTARGELDRRGIRPEEAHAANSAALARYPEARLDAVRPGLALYGGGPRAELGLEAVMSLVTEVVALRQLEPGDTVSYGATWKAIRPSRIAVLPVGYADGYPRRVSGHAVALLAGRRCPVVGTVCMDMIMVDVTPLGDAIALGTEAVLLGSQGAEEVTVTELAAWAGTVEYEILCGISKRVPRRYFGADLPMDTIG